MNDFTSLILRVSSYSMNLFDSINRRILSAPDNFHNIIQELAKDEFFMKAIYYASPSLHQAFGANSSKNSASTKRTDVAIYKYLSRMCNRPTPFGLFAGLNVAYLQQVNTTVEIAGHAQHMPLIRLDMEYIFKLMHLISEDVRVKSQVRYFINNTVYKVGPKKSRYIEQQFVNDSRQYNVSEFENSDFINTIIHKFRQTGVTFPEFIAFTRQEGIDDELSREFYFTLSANQLLTSELDINVTGTLYFRRLVDKINLLEGIEDVKARINTLSDILSALNSDEQDPVTADLQISDLYPEIYIAKKFQVDLKVSFKRNVVNKRVADHLSANLSQIIDCFAQPAVNTNLDTFKRLFLERYGDAEVPLTVLLDPDTGIPYSDTKVGSTPLIENIIRKSGQSEYAYETVSRFKIMLINRFLDENSHVIELKDSDIVGFKYDIDSTKNSVSNLYYALGSVISASGEAMDALNYKFEIKALINGSAANLISRFGHLDEEILHIIKATIEKERELPTGWINAEIVHLNSNEGNVVIRPHLRDYEIPFASLSCLSPDKQIPINDIYVSVKNNLVILRSKRLNKYVRARLSTAHLYNTGLPVYRFLGDVQNQGMSTKLNWNWDMFSDLSYCPRVVYKNIILTKARWIIDKSSLESFTIQVLRKHLVFLAAEKHLPRLININEGDNELLLDLTVDISGEILYDYIKANKRVTISESLNQDLSSFVERGEERFANEILLSFFSDRTPENVGTEKVCNPKRKSQQLKRVFLPFEDCLSLKIYCGEKIAEQVLIKELKKIADTFQGVDAKNYWFFLRYHDPESHIKIRFFSTDKIALFNMLSAINGKLKPYLESNLIFSVQIDTYRREYERYGRLDIKKFETFFFRDSCLCLQLISYVTAYVKDENYRIFAAVRLLDCYLAKHLKSPDDKYHFCKKQKQLFVNEFKGSIDYKQSLKSKYRDYKILINKVLDSSYENVDDIHLKHIFKLIAEDDNSHKADELSFVTTESQLASLFHMTVNRIFLTEQRLHEMFIYDFLENAYKSISVKIKQNAYAG